MPFNLRSNVVCKFSCGRYSVTYYGETCRHLNIRVGEHLHVSPLTRKKSKAKTSTAIRDHMLLCNHVVSLEDFKILASSNSEFHLKIKESLFISRDKSDLYNNEVFATLLIWLIYSSSNTLFVQDRNIITIVLSVSLQFLSVVSYYLLKWALMIFEENMLVKEKFFTYNGLIMRTG